MKASPHDQCLIDTYMLEVEMFGEPVSASVLERVREIDLSRRLNAAAQYGGSREMFLTPNEIRELGQQFLKGPPPPPPPYEPLGFS